MPKAVFKHLIIGYMFMGAALFSFANNVMWLAIVANLIGLYHFIKARMSWNEK